MAGIGSIGGPNTYVRTAATNPAPGLALGSAITRAIAPAAVFVLASAPAAAAAAVSTLDTNSVDKPHSMLAIGLGAGGLIAASIATYRTCMSDWSGPSAFFTGFSGALGMATSSIAIVAGLSEDIKPEAGLDVQAAIVGDVLAAAACALYLHANRTKRNS